jgi:hypothetical protein
MLPSQVTQHSPTSSPSARQKGRIAKPVFLDRRAGTRVQQRKPPLPASSLPVPGAFTPGSCVQVLDVDKSGGPSVYCQCTVVGPLLTRAAAHVVAPQCTVSPTSCALLQFPEAPPVIHHIVLHVAHGIGIPHPELETNQNRQMLPTPFRVWSEDEACLKAASDELQLVFRHQTLNMPGADKSLGFVDKGLGFRRLERLSAQCAWSGQTTRRDGWIEREIEREIERDG